MVDSHNSLLSDDAIARARQIGLDEAQAVYAVSAKYLAATRSFEIGLSTGWSIQVPQSFSALTNHASEDACNNVQITDSGLGLHWADLDEDWYVPAVLDSLVSQRLVA